MRVLLDTNILIHREAATVVRQDIGKLFFWLDRLKYQKWVHPARSYLINGRKPLRDRRFALLPFRKARIYCFSEGVRQRNPCLMRPSSYL